MHARRAFVACSNTNLPSGICNHLNVCIHQIMPLQRGEANLLNGLLTPGLIATMPHARLRNGHIIGSSLASCRLFFEAHSLLTSAPTGELNFFTASARQMLPLKVAFGRIYSNF